MRLPVFLVCLLLMVSPAAAQDSLPIDVDAIAARAAEYYAIGNIDAAAGLYQSLVSAGIADEDIHFNLGSIYLQAGDLGRAALNFRAGLEIAPRDAEINAALAAVRLQRVDLLGDETALVDSLAALSARIVTHDELLRLVWWLWAGWCCMLTVWVSAQRWRRFLRPIAAGLLLVFGFVTVLAASRTYVDANRPAAVVVAPVAQVYSGPDVNYLAIYQIHSAAEVRILEQRGEWVRFVLPDERQGWIQANAVEAV